MPIAISWLCYGERRLGLLNSENGQPIRLLIQTENIRGGVAESNSNLRCVRAHWLHDLAAVHLYRRDRQRDAWGNRRIVLLLNSSGYFVS